jgi:Threonylcarbamoyl adenosine biosynthesis protein TsaE
MRAYVRLSIPPIILLSWMRLTTSFEFFMAANIKHQLTRKMSITPKVICRSSNNCLRMLVNVRVNNMHVVKELNNFRSLQSSTYGIIPSVRKIRRWNSSMDDSRQPIMEKSISLAVPTAEDMEEIGAFLSSIILQPSPEQECAAGRVVFLNGDLGAGKTVFARGFIRAATGNYEQQVTSPTYLLSNTYRRPSDTCDDHYKQ